jgi:hypothetical protein
LEHDQARVESVAAEPEHGTAKSGHGQNNRLVIPARWSDDRVRWENLRDPIAIERSVGGRDVIALGEPVIKGFTHCCTPADVLAMLELLAAEDLGDLRLFGPFPIL